MPHKKRKIQFEEFVRVLKGHDLNATKLAKVLGCTYPTAKAKLDNPLKLTLGDLLAIHYKGHISSEEIIGAIEWD